MIVDKKIIGELERCYSVAVLQYNNTGHLLVAAEKVNKCMLFDLDGNYEETVWDGPGGTMSMVQIPGSNGQFLATHRFYSPNDSEEASIVIVTPRAKNDWEVRTLVKLPFVHRFDIINRNGINYLIACTIKSGHKYKDDWSNPGKVYTAVLPDNFDNFDDENQLPLEVIKDGMPKNHGYTRHMKNRLQSAVISCENGVYLFTPPDNVNGKWTIEELISTPASDALLLDFNEDGVEELLVFSPFHGNNLAIYNKINGRYEMSYIPPEKTEFLHAIYESTVCGKPAAIVGYRGGDRSLWAITHEEAKGYGIQVLDTNTGPANVLCYKHNGKEVILATNREINEIAMYTIQ